MGGDRQSVGSEGAGDAFSDETLQSMAFRGWWSELRADTEPIPNAKNMLERQLDYIEVGELFKECTSDLVESGTPANAIGSQVTRLLACCARARAGASRL